MCGGSATGTSSARDAVSGGDGRAMADEDGCGGVMWGVTGRGGLRVAARATVVAKVREQVDTAAQVE